MYLSWVRSLLNFHQACSHFACYILLKSLPDNLQRCYFSSSLGITSKSWLSKKPTWGKSTSPSLGILYSQITTYDFWTTCRQLVSSHHWSLLQHWRYLSFYRIEKNDENSSAGGHQTESVISREQGWMGMQHCFGQGDGASAAEY